MSGLDKRYTWCTDYDRADPALPSGQSETRYLVVKDGATGQMLHEVAYAYWRGGHWNENDAEDKRARTEVEAWLDEHFPAYEDPLAYWD